MYIIFDSKSSVIKAATYTTTGTKRYTCAKCGKTKDEVIPVLVCSSHSWDSGVVTKEATYTTTGTKKYTCTKCGDTKEEIIPVLVCTSHNWDNGVVTKASTCTEPGVMTYTCTICGKTKTENIPCVEHSYSWVRTKEPAESESGLEEYMCSVCKHVNGTQSVDKLQDLGQETDWVYSGDSRTKTMYDGTVITETKYNTSAGSVWGWYDDSAASDMFSAIQYIQKYAYGDANVAVWDGNQANDARLMTAGYAAQGSSSEAFHMNSGGLPNVSDNKQYITYVNSYGGGLAISCFVRDSAAGASQFTYGESWRSYFGTYYASSY